MSTKATTITVGIDIGSESTKVVLGPTASCEIVRSSVGGHTTPTAISFATKSHAAAAAAAAENSSRLIGADANLKSNQALIHLNRLLPGNHDTVEDDPFRPFYRFQVDDEQNQVTLLRLVADDEGATTTTTTTFPTAAVIAMLLGKLRQSVQETLKRMQLISAEDNNDSRRIEYILTLPPDASTEAHAILQDAAFAAGLCDDSSSTANSKIQSTASCLAAAYQRKFPDPPAITKTVVMVDMGHAQTTVTVLRLNHANEDKSTETTNENNNSAKIQILSSISHSSLGAGSVDVRLWHHFGKTIPALKDVASQPNSREGQRLLEACRKLKHILSQLTTGSVTVENIQDHDVVISCTRQALAELCQAETTALQELLQRAVAKAVQNGSDTDDGDGGDDEVVKETTLVVDTVEVLGGGCRIPLFQRVICETLGVSQLSHTLDDTSVALGAAVLGNDPSLFVMNTEPDTEAMQIDGGNRESFRQQLRAAEKQMAKIDEEMAQRGEIRNKIEAHVLEMRSVQQQSNGKHSALLPDASLLNAHLDQIDDWLFSSQADAASLSEMQAKLDAVVNKTNEMCHEYLQALKAEREAKEKEMEEEAKRAKAERDAAGDDDDDDDDHDNRRLPKKRRMEIVMKNKAEANELFSHGNYRHAAARYTKALTHCTKFVDLSPEDLEEVKGVKLSLNLNLALAYFKLEKYDQALRVSNEALELDGDSAKALYRRATVFFEKKRWEDAQRDLDKAAKNAPQDKAIQKLQAKVELQMKKQKVKEKKMAQKMFG